MKKHIELLMMASIFAGLESPVIATGRRKLYSMPIPYPHHKEQFPLIGEREFTIDGITVVATSEKNARRQVKRLKIVAKNSH
jgi:hypothetical protein